MEEKDIEARVEKARALFQEGYNCAQAVFLTYSDMFGMDTALAAQLAASFGGGMGRMREVCGTVSGMAMIAGLMELANDPKDKEAKARNAALVREFADAFRQKNGSIICRELLGLDKKEGDASVHPASAHAQGLWPLPPGLWGRNWPDNEEINRKEGHGKFQ